MAKQIVTQEAVNQACKALFAEGLDPSIVTVQERVGGGSYTTVKRYLDIWKQQRAETVGEVSIPDVVQAKAAELVRAVWLAASTEAGQQIQRIQEETNKVVHIAQTELRDAQTEISRLENIETEQAGMISSLHNKLHDTEIALAGAQAQALRVDELSVALEVARNTETVRSEEMGRLKGETETLRTQLTELIETLKNKN